MTLSARLTTELGSSVSYKLIVDTECRSQSILKCKVFLFMCDSLLVVETSLAVFSVLLSINWSLQIPYTSVLMCHTTAVDALEI